MEEGEEEDGQKEDERNEEEEYDNTDGCEDSEQFLTNFICNIFCPKHLIVVL